MIDAPGLLGELIRVDTTNPPGHEAAAAALISQALHDHGIHVDSYAKDPHRPNLVARVQGRDEASPLLLQAHMDVVPTTDQRWTRDPFAGAVVDGWIWGRGALDMKGPLVMMLDALVRVAADDEPPPGDVIFMALSDEERLGTFGARFLVEEHPELFDGVRFCLGEFGGFPLRLGGTTFYPIQIAERTGVYLECTFEGSAGHGSLGVEDGAMARLGEALVALDRKRLPVQITPAARLMLEGLVEHTTGATRLAVRSLLDERTATAALGILRSRLGILEPMLRSTVNPTIVQGGSSPNVIPASVTLGLDGRMLPGVTVDEMVTQVRRIIGNDVTITPHAEDTPTVADEPDMALFSALADAIRRLDPDGVPLPFLMPAVTDGRWFATLGIQPFGFHPMDLPDGFDFQKTVHAADERIPVPALEFGARAIADVLRNRTV